MEPGGRGATLGHEGRRENRGKLGHEGRRENAEWVTPRGYLGYPAPRGKWGERVRAEKRATVTFRGSRPQGGSWDIWPPRFGWSPVGSGEKGESGGKGDRGVQGLLGPQGPSPSSGGLYTRWGRTTCPDVDGTETVYSGRAGGSSYGTNFACMPNDPEYSSSSTGRHIMYGVEYNNHPIGSDIEYHNAPCAVCYTSTRYSILMLPAKLTCPPNWTTEYSGYIMTDTDRYASLHECVDSNPESIPGHDANDGLHKISSVRAYCHNNYGLSCPPYSTANKALTCVVCSR